MVRPHAAIALPLAGLALGLALPASAQDEDYQQIVVIMRACAQIEDVAARVTCYDNNIGPRAGAVAAVPAMPAAANSPVVSRQSGMGAEQLPQVRQATRAQEIDEVRARLAAVERVGSGLYLMTLDDGAQWEFVDAAPFSYDPPSAGANVRIERGALGSYRMVYNRQQGLRVRRVR